MCGNQMRSKAVKERKVHPAFVAFQLDSCRACLTQDCTCHAFWRVLAYMLMCGLHHADRLNALQADMAFISRYAIMYNLEIIAHNQREYERNR